ncbi:MAG: hypothetical protein DRP78_01055 [Candidatus Omnitrophota bacterium]|nr:MAG: hypothetical protein DRP78_01055 [Candidatus Omnitrophota bacterium]
MNNLAVHKNQAQMIFIISMVMLGSFYFIFLFSPLLKEFLQYDTSVKQLKLKLQTVESVVKNRDRLLTEIEAIKKQITEYENRLPREINRPQILKEIIAMGSSNDITFVSIAPQEIRKVNFLGDNKFYFVAPIRLKLKAGYSNLGIFINNIENFKHVMRIDNLSISADSGNIEKHNIDLEISSFALNEYAGEIDG